jgi:hypothetical protein
LYEFKLKVKAMETKERKCHICGGNNWGRRDIKLAGAEEATEEILTCLDCKAKGLASVILLDKKTGNEILKSK